MLKSSHILGLFALTFSLSLIGAGRSAALQTPGRLGLLAWDAAGYYAYLPGVWIHHDLGFTWSEQESGVPHSHFVYPSGAYSLNRYPLGPAILQLPFFLAAHSVALITNATPNGYSAPYRQALLIGAACYVGLGLFLLGIVLHRWFSLSSVLLTLVSLGWGTNLFYYATFEAMMSHVYSFFLFAVVLWAGLNWRMDGQRRAFLLYALAGGLIAATRISNVPVLLIPLVWGWGKAGYRTALFHQLGMPIQYWAAGVLLFLIPLLPQSIYIFQITEKVIYPTYGNEGFFWTDPLISKVLLSPRKGWLWWSPILILGFVGWIRLRSHPGFRALSLIGLLQIYIVSSWWCWWYGGGFGMRALIENSTILAFGMAALFDWCRRYPISTPILSSLLPILLLWNMFLTHQYKNGIIHWDSMSRSACHAILGYRHPAPPEVMDQRNQHLHFPDYDKAKYDREYRRSL